MFLIYNDQTQIFEWQEQIRLGKQVLYLLPEIALSTQIYSRLRKIFGTSLGVYHSKFSDNERVETYRGLKNGDYQVILGSCHSKI